MLLPQLSAQTHLQLLAEFMHTVFSVQPTQVVQKSWQCQHPLWLCTICQCSQWIQARGWCGLGQALTKLGRGGACLCHCRPVRCGRGREKRTEMSYGCRQLQVEVSFNTFILSYVHFQCLEESSDCMEKRDSNLFSHCTSIEIPSIFQQPKYATEQQRLLWFHFRFFVLFSGLVLALQMRWFASKVKLLYFKLKSITFQYFSTHTFRPHPVSLPGSCGLQALSALPAVTTHPLSGTCDPWWTRWTSQFPAPEKWHKPPSWTYKQALTHPTHLIEFTGQQTQHLLIEVLFFHLPAT